MRLWFFLWFLLQSCVPQREPRIPEPAEYVCPEELDGDCVPPYLKQEKWSVIC